MIVSRFKLFIVTILKIYIFLFKGQEKRLTESVTILLNTPMGIGDSIMLSPLFESFDHYSKKFVITDLPWILHTVDWMVEKQVKDFEGLLIVPSFSLKSLKTIFRWKGLIFIRYGNDNVLHSRNLKLANTVLPSGHYLEPLSGFINNDITYPSLISDEELTKFDLVIFPYVNWNSRQWPKEKWITLIEKLPSSCKIGILGGSKSDEILFNRCFEIFTNVVNLTGKCTLKQTVSIIENSKLILCQDSGPFHIASLSNTPVIVIFGVTKADSRIGLTRDISSKISVIENRKCPHHSCYNGLTEPNCKLNEKYSCIREIPINEVLFKVRELLCVE